MFTKICCRIVIAQINAVSYLVFQPSNDLHVNLKKFSSMLKRDVSN